MSIKGSRWGAQIMATPKQVLKPLTLFGWIGIQTRLQHVAAQPIPQFEPRRAKMSIEPVTKIRGESKETVFLAKRKIWNMLGKTRTIMKPRTPSPVNIKPFLGLLL